MAQQNRMKHHSSKDHLASYFCLLRGQKDRLINMKLTEKQIERRTCLPAELRWRSSVARVFLSVMGATIRPFVNIPHVCPMIYER